MSLVPLKDSVLPYLCEENFYGVGPLGIMGGTNVDIEKQTTQLESITDYLKKEYNVKKKDEFKNRENLKNFKSENDLKRERRPQWWRAKKCSRT